MNNLISLSDEELSEKIAYFLIEIYESKYNIKINNNDQSLYI